jgi:hypothetical protein
MLGGTRRLVRQLREIPVLALLVSLTACGGGGSGGSPSGGDASSSGVSPPSGEVLASIDATAQVNNPDTQTYAFGALAADATVASSKRSARSALWTSPVSVDSL